MGTRFIIPREVKAGEKKKKNWRRGSTFRIAGYNRVSTHLKSRPLIIQANKQKYLLALAGFGLAGSLSCLDLGGRLGPEPLVGE